MPLRRRQDSIRACPPRLQQGRGKPFILAGRRGRPPHCSRSHKTAERYRNSNQILYLRGTVLSPLPFHPGILGRSMRGNRIQLGAPTAIQEPPRCVGGNPSRSAVSLGRDSRWRQRRQRRALKHHDKNSKSSRWRSCAPDRPTASAKRKCWSGHRLGPASRRLQMCRGQERFQLGVRRIAGLTLR